MGLLLLLLDLVLAVTDMATGRSRRRYEHTIEIRAPRDIVWSMLKARDIAFEGRLPVRIVAEEVEGRPGIERVRILAGTTRLQMTTRIVDERPTEAILYELLPDGTDPMLIEGDDDYIGFVLVDLPKGTRLDLMRETSPRHWISRLTVPLGLRSGARRYKRKAEAMFAAAAQPGAKGEEAA